MSVVRNCLSGLISPAVLGAAISMTATGAMANPCTGPDISTTAETKCLTAVAIPGNPLRSFDISWVNPKRGEYYLGDRSNSGIDVIDTNTLKWKRTIGGFVGVVLSGTAVNNNLSGPDGVTSHGRWLYGGDGNSTLKVIDLDAPPMAALQQSISTGGMFRVDEMALDSDGDLLLAANNADDPAFATLFVANGDNPKSHVKIITKVTIDPSIMPVGFETLDGATVVGSQNPALLGVSTDHRQQSSRVQLRANATNWLAAGDASDHLRRWLGCHKPGDAQCADRRSRRV